MGRTHDTVISNFDLDRLEAELEHAERERDEALAALKNYKAQSIHTCHDQCQQPMCLLRRELEAERALADLLASSLLLTLSAWITSPDAERAAAALAAWKEARSE